MNFDILDFVPTLLMTNHQFQAWILCNQCSVQLALGASKSVDDDIDDDDESSTLQNFGRIVTFQKLPINSKKSPPDQKQGKITLETTLGHLKVVFWPLLYIIYILIKNTIFSPN